MSKRSDKDLPPCADTVPNGFGLFVACPYKGRIERDGKHYCKRHDPEARKARREKASRRASWEVELGWAKNAVEQAEARVIKLARRWRKDRAKEPLLEQAVDELEKRRAAVSKLRAEGPPQ